MKLLANENFPLKSVEYLEGKGFDIIAVGVKHPSVKDNIVINVAIREDRLILTFDRDYGELIFRHNYRPKMGVIYLRLDAYEPDEPGKIIDDLLRNNKLEFQNALTVLDKHGIRQRKY